MDGRSPEADEQPSPFGYILAIVLSALGHAVAIALAFFILPAYFRQGRAPLPAYSVKIVDQLPAGDLGTHLPRLSSRKRTPAQKAKAEPPKPENPKIVPEPPRLAREPDKNAIALNTIHSPTPEPTPKPMQPTPTPTPEPTIPATPEPTPPPTPAPTRAAPKPTAKTKHQAKPKAKPTPKRTERKKHEVKPPVEIAKVERKPSVEEQLSTLREQLMAQHLANEKKSLQKREDASSNPSKAGPSGGGPVVADRAIEGNGAGIGPGSGSAGVQKDPEFLLYYRTVQERVKKAWNFSGGSGDLTTTVTFAIGADGSLTSVQITQSSHDSAFDDSVIRAIRRAAPFPAPPENYRSQFAEGIEAVFRLGELSS
jgi:periplasmic protein TonB